MNHHPSNALASAVTRLATTIQPVTDNDLGQPFRWMAHDEGIRLAVLGSMHELRGLAVDLAADRRHNGRLLTRAHHALGQYHAAYRDLQAILLGVTAEEFDASPAPGEWPLRNVFGHMVGAERWFFSLVHYGLRRRREGGDLPVELPQDEPNTIIGPYADYRALMNSGTLEDIAAYHARMHDRALTEFADISDEELESPSLWWEGKAYTLEYRLHRFDAHLRQHTIQIEKTLDQLGRPANEARRLARLLYAALAEVEAAVIGVTNLGVASREQLAAILEERTDAIVVALGRAHKLIASIKTGDGERVEALLAEDAGLANATDENGVPAARLAAYHNEWPLAEMLANLVAEPEPWDVAALGRTEALMEIVGYAGESILNEYSRDGYTSLQLACFFGHEKTAAWLVEKGADVSAISMNRMAIQPIHAAAAGNHLGIVRLLLEAGADPNAVQQDSFRPLHAAAQNGNAAMAALLLAHGADPKLTDAQDHTARYFAEQGNHEAVLALLPQP